MSHVISFVFCRTSTLVFLKNYKIALLHKVLFFKNQEDELFGKGKEMGLVSEDGF